MGEESGSPFISPWVLDRGVERQCSQFGVLFTDWEYTRVGFTGSDFFLGTKCLLFVYIFVLKFNFSTMA